MRDDEPDITALIKAVAEAPRRDNSTYHQAIADARRAFEAAEQALGGPVEVRTRAKQKRNGKYVVKWTFTRID